MQQLAKNESHLNKKKTMQSKDVRIKSSDTSLEALANSRLEARGVDTTNLKQSLAAAGEEVSKSRKRARSEEFDSEEEDDMDVEDGPDKKKKGFKSRRPGLTSNGKRQRTISLSTKSRLAETEGSMAPRQLKQVHKEKRTLERHLIRFAKGGEGDHQHYPKLVKHLNSGKSSLGTSTIGR